MDILVKTISDAGLGTGSLIALIIVIWQQLKIIKGFQAAIEENTLVTRLLSEKIQSQIESEKESRRIIDRCKFNQKSFES